MYKNEIKDFTNLNKERLKEIKTKNFIEFIEFKMDKTFKNNRRGMTKSWYFSVKPSKTNRKKDDKKANKKRKWLNTKKCDLK